MSSEERRTQLGKDLILAVGRGDKKNVEQCLNGGANINYQHFSGSSALHEAARKGGTEIARFLIDHGININLQNVDGSTALHEAALNGQTEIVRLLIDRGIDINLPKKDGSTALLLAVSNRKTEIVTLLIDRGIDINLPKNDGSTALHLAVSSRKTEIVTLLIDRGIDINLPKHDGSSALHNAALRGQIEIVRLLVDHGININLQNENGSTALHNAAWHGETEIVRLLIDRGIDINLPNNDSSIALHYAAWSGQYEIVRLLINRGININLQNEEGDTALHIASKLRYRQIVECLLSKGCDPYIPNNEGKKPIDEIKDYPKIKDRIKFNVRSLTKEPWFTAKSKEYGKTFLPGLPAEVKKFDKKSAQVFSSLLKEESYPHFESRLMLAGEQGTGKTTLARYLVGKRPTRYRISTDGIELYNGLSYMDRESKDWLGGMQDFSLEDITVSRSLLKEDKMRKRQDVPVEPQKTSIPGGKENLRHESNETLTFDKTTEESEHDDVYHEVITADTSHLKEDIIKNGVKLEAGTSKSRDVLAIALAKSSPTSDGDLIQESNIILKSDTTQERSQLKNDITQADRQCTTLPVDVFSIAEPLGKQLSDGGSEKKIKTQYNDDEYETGIEDKLPISQKQLGSLITDRKKSVRSRNINELVQQHVLSGNENTQSLNNRDSRENFPDNATQIDDTDVSPTKSCFSDETHIETVTKPGLIRKLKNIFGVSKRVKEVKVSITKEKFLKKSSRVGKKQLHNKKIAPIIIWDFGGQDVFYSTHQTFLTYRAIYMVVLDGSRKLDDPCPYEQYLPGKGQHKTARDYLLFWINTIVTYCKGGNQGFPKIMVVLTHKDQVKAKEIEKRRHEIFGEINKMFQQTPLGQHLVIEDKIFVNAKDKHDTEMEKIKEVIISESERQPTWGELLPKCFIPLELEFASLTKRNIPLITLDHLKKINSLQPIRPLSEDELKVFLKFQHSIGKLLYFDELKLDDRIVLSPTLLIDAFKSIVTDRQFCKGDRNREEIWDAMGMKGVVFKQAIYEVWKRKKYAKFNKEKDYLLAVMTHLDILVEPKRYDSSRTRIPADFYYVASMVRAIDDSGYLQSAGIIKRNIALAFESSSLMIPPALSFRFISYCLSVWAVKTYGENNKDMLFHRSGVFTIDPSLDMYILCEDDKISVRLVHTRTNTLIMRDLASSINECLTSALEKISQLYIRTSSDQNHTSDASFVTSVCCNSPDKPCILPFENLAYVDKIWTCPAHGIEHPIHIIKSWISGNEEDGCEPGCPVTNEEFLKELPSDLHLRRLSLMYSSNDVRELAIHLGLSATDVNVTVDTGDQTLWNFEVFRRCRDSKAVTFKEIAKAIEDNEKGNMHSLCKVVKGDFIGFDREPEKWDVVPTEEHIDRLVPLVGKQSIQFLIELGMDFHTWERISHKQNERDLVRLNKDILEEWSNKFCRMHSLKPTLRTIAQSFSNIGKNVKIVENALLDLF